MTAVSAILTGCGDAGMHSLISRTEAKSTETISQETTENELVTKNDNEDNGEITEMNTKVLDLSQVFENITPADSIKGLTDHNPVMVQRFGADPYALVYDGRVYIYMTGDKPSYNEDGSVKENTYSNINTINVI